MSVVAFPRAPEPIDPRDTLMTEAQLLSRCIGLAQWLGLKYFHSYSGLVCQVGYPDLTIAGPCGFIIRECKAAYGTLSEAQEAWRLELRAAGVNYAVWTPADWRLNRCQEQMHALAGMELAA